MKLKRLIPAVALAAGLIGTSAHAENFLDFCVDVASTGFTSAQNTTLENGPNGCVGVGAQAGLTGFTADQIAGTYNEKVVAAQVGSNLFFQSTTLLNFARFLRNEAGSPITGAQSGLGSVGGYGLYAIVTATGAVSGNSFVASGATLDLYLDKNLDTGTEMSDILVDPITNALSVVIGTDDVLLGSSNTLLSGSGTTAASAGTDGFAVTFNNFALTSPEGELFFIAPRPFHIRAYSDGDINDGSVAIVPGVALEFNGAADAVFVVPEPTSLALVGLALVGIGAVGARRKSV